MAKSKQAHGREPIKAVLLHLGYNMWCDRELPDPQNSHIVARPYLRFDMSLWNDLVKQMAEARLNMLVIDLGEAEVLVGKPGQLLRGLVRGQRSTPHALEHLSLPKTRIT